VSFRGYAQAEKEKEVLEARLKAALAVIDIDNENNAIRKARDAKLHEILEYRIRKYEAFIQAYPNPAKVPAKTLTRLKECREILNEIETKALLLVEEAKT